MWKMCIGLMFSLVMAVILSGCPEYGYAGPAVECQWGPEDPGVPQRHCVWEADARDECGGCAVTSRNYGYYFPCREDGAEGGQAVDSEKCKGKTNPQKCTVKVYKKEGECSLGTKETCRIYSCKYELYETY